MRHLDLPAPEWQEPGAAVRQVEIPIRVVTPMFGGGYRAREIDKDQPVRSASVRGHLRFWWRATRGSRGQDAEKLFEAEEQIWGSDRVPGKIAIRVRTDGGGKEIGAESLSGGKPDPRRGPGLGYFLFSLCHDNKQPEAIGREKVGFSLSLRTPVELWPEVETAVRAWIAFGGVGCRTRRGCGALASTGDWTAPADFRTWLNQLVGTGRVGTARFTELAGGRIVLGERVSDAMAAWRTLADFWAQFHKGHVGDTRYEPMRGGRWGDYAALSQARRDPPAEIALAKPFLGLPTVYQRFPRGGFEGTLQPGDSGRMASPIILKPLALSDGGFRPMVLALAAPRPGNIRVNEGRPMALSVNDEDPVLQELGVDDPADAVMRAAEALWRVGAETFRMGGKA